MRNKKRIISILMGIFILLGVGVISYPFLGFYMANRDQTYAISKYDETYSKMKEEEKTALLDSAYEYNKELKTTVITDPFTKSTDTLGSEYNQMLNIGGTGMMGYIQIPKIRVNLPIYHGTSVKALEKGVGHMEKTHLPVGGEGTHAVLTGHTGLESSVLFTNLSKIKIKDRFYITVLGKTIAYQVDKIKVVTPSETEDLVVVPGKDYVTLITCTPYGINSHRLLVRGTRVDYNQAELKEGIKLHLDFFWILMIIMIVLLVIFIGVVVITRKQKNCN